MARPTVRLAAAGFADQPERLALLQREATRRRPRAPRAILRSEDAAEDRKAARADSAPRESAFGIWSLAHRGYRWQRTQWPGAIFDERRLDVARTARTGRGQRVTNLQPAGRSRMLGHVAGNGRAGARAFRRRRAGSEAEQPLRVRMQRIAEQLARPARSPESCRRTSPRRDRRSRRRPPDCA